MPAPRKHANRADKQRAYRQRQRQARIDEQSAKGLPPLPPIPTMPGTARWKAVIDAATVQLDMMWNEMGDYYDERSDQWKESEKGEEHKARAEFLEAALAELDEIAF